MEDRDHASSGQNGHAHRRVDSSFRSEVAPLLAEISLTSPRGGSPSQERFSALRKFGILVAVSFACFISFFTAHSFTPDIREVAFDLDTTNDVVDLSVGVFIFFNAFGSLFWARYAEFYGRRPIYLISLPLYILSCFAAALSSRPSHLIVFRGLQSFGISSFATVGAGVLADIFDSESIGLALGFFTGVAALAPAVAPLAGRAFVQKTSWRSLQLLLASVGALALFIAYFFLPETIFPGSRVDMDKSVHSDESSGECPRFAWKVRDRWLVLLNPLKSLRALLKLDVALICIFVSIMAMTEVALLDPLPSLLNNAYGINNPHVLSGVLLTSSVGNLIGAPLAGRLSDIQYRQERVGHRIPIARLRAAFIGAMILVPLSVLAYRLPFRLSDVANGVVGVVAILIFNGIGVSMCLVPCMAYLTDGLDANLIEALAAIYTIITIAVIATSASMSAMLSALGIVWNMLLIAGLAWFGGGILYALMRLGTKRQTIALA